ncbi:histone-lysine N-methyltransferase SETMAR [Trichonephila clavipes]|nr:histone-lysine N-methyltransferase SETMAR [Trichonephila clavipes]
MPADAQYQGGEAGVIFRSLLATYALLCLFTMSVLIENPAACEIRCVIRFLNAKKVKPIEIYRQICEVYGQNAMSDSMVRRWVRQFNEGRSEVHDEERSGRPSLITEELVHAIDEKIKENRFGWDVFDHPPYSPGLAPSDFHLFLHLKSFLAGKHFNNDKELKENVSNWLKTQATTFYEEGIEKLVPRYDTCLQNFGSNVER